MSANELKKKDRDKLILEAQLLAWYEIWLYADATERFSQMMERRWLVEVCFGYHRFPPHGLTINSFRREIQQYLAWRATAQPDSAQVSDYIAKQLRAIKLQWPESEMVIALDGVIEELKKAGLW